MHARMRHVVTLRRPTGFEARSRIGALRRGRSRHQYRLSNTRYGKGIWSQISFLDVPVVIWWMREIRWPVQEIMRSRSRAC